MKTRKLRDNDLVRWLLPFLLMFVLWLTTGLSPSRAGTPPIVSAATATILPDLVEKVSPGVVNISSTKFIKSYGFYGPGSDENFMRFFGLAPEHAQKQSSLGSGFIIDADGYILTNNHVVEHADEIMILLLDNRRLPARIIGRDKSLDIALLQLKGGAGNKNLKPVSLGNSEAIRIGESVFAIGNPFGLHHTVTAGIISAKDRTIGLGSFDRFLQTDCSINFGNSGGPLFNFKGEVIGINTAINAQGQGLGFAIPISQAQVHLEELKKYGRIIRPWLGLLGVNITPAIQNHYDLPADHGVVITNLVERAPIEKAGCRIGDIVTSFNGKIIKEAADIQKELWKLKPDQEVTLHLKRGYQTISKTIVLKAAPDLEGLPADII